MTYTVFSNVVEIANITHVIVNAFDLDVHFAAVVRGLWVLKPFYVEACIKTNKILSNFSKYEYQRFSDKKIKASKVLASVIGVGEATKHEEAKRLGDYTRTSEYMDRTLKLSNT